MAYLAFIQWSWPLSQCPLSALVCRVSLTLGQGNPLLAPCGLLGLPTVEFAVPSVSIDFPCYMVSLTLGQGNPLLAPCGLLGLPTVEFAAPSVSTVRPSL